MMLVMMMMITDRTSHSNRPDIVILGKTVKEARLIDVAVPKSHNLHSAITERFQTYADLKGEPIRIWQMKTVCIIP